MAGRTTLQPSDIGLIISYKCQSGCKHCLYNCGPEWKDWISLETAQAAIEAIRQIDSVTQVHITGGEPFLNFPLLLSVVKMIVAEDILCYTETNAGWCVNSDLVSDYFHQLDDAGLKAVLISCSPFHAETIPLTRTILAIDRALAIFGPNRVLIYLLEWIDQILRFGTHTPTPINRYIEAYGMDPAGLMLWDGYSLISGGRAGYQLGFLTSRKPASRFRGQICRVDILEAPHAHFDLYGNFIPGFCGGLSLGSWRQISDLIETYENDQMPSLIEILVEQGPYGLYQYASRAFGYKPQLEGFAGKCHLCVDVRLHLHQHAEFAELQPREFYNSSLWELNDRNY